jgi:hypothetical protein
MTDAFGLLIDMVVAVSRGNCLSENFAVIPKIGPLQDRLSIDRIAWEIGRSSLACH